ncbi:hypothetical protein [Cellulomonas gilvus]|uniref:Uncharacterized protein n=1 Tax=Cellulomonas gilvus (strain ATCC 13127 / NRRL B-14078) TaxID=593907 RepID=F8A4W2_CELGA|nr:hypothetical protein [Cellulomonas gilvus]AEI12065.1 hypothetical protein Celgi_1554 [Cellulomonas gilvus ATCC 13127]
MSTTDDTQREHPVEPAEGAPAGTPQPTSDPREHPDEPAEGGEV